MTEFLPDRARPQAVDEAHDALVARERDVAEAKEAVGEAQAGVAAAEGEDALEVAKALDEGADDCGRAHYEAAQRHLAEAERRLKAHSFAVIALATPSITRRAARFRRRPGPGHSVTNPRPIRAALSAPGATLNYTAVLLALCTFVRSDRTGFC